MLVSVVGGDGRLGSAYGSFIGICEVLFFEQRWSGILITWWDAYVKGYLSYS